MLRRICNENRTHPENKVMGYVDCKETGDTHGICPECMLEVRKELYARRGIKRVETFEELFQMVRDRRAVIIPGSENFSDPVPAAFVVNLPAFYLNRLLSQGIYLYERRKR